MQILGDKVIKGYYIHFQGRSSIGVSKKIDMQLKIFNQYFETAEVEVETIERSLYRRIIDLWPTRSISRRYERALEYIKEPDFVYIRRTCADGDYLRFLKRIKEKFPCCKVIIEIYTYPYDKIEFGMWNTWPFFLKEISNRNKLQNYVDRFVTYSDDNVIFGIKTIVTGNGVIVDGIKKVGYKHSKDMVTMIGVAHMQKHHGYERLIEGIRLYYANLPSLKVNLILIGDGPEKGKYRKLVKEYGLDRVIKFYPEAVDEELDDYYNMADIGVGFFGGYKEKLWSNSTLKTAEYIARGLPVVSGIQEEAFKNEKPPFYMEVCNSADPVDIEEVIRFFNSIYRDDLCDTIRKYAINSVDLEGKMSPVINYIKGAGE